MRHHWASLVTLCALAPASNALAVDLAFQGQLEISFGSASVSTTGVGVASVNSGGGGLDLTRLAIPASVFAVTDTATFGSTAPTISGLPATAFRVVLAGNGAATWVRGTTGMTSTVNVGEMPLMGGMRLCLLTGCASPVDVGLSVAAATAPTSVSAVAVGTSMSTQGFALPLQMPVRTGVGTHTVPTSSINPLIKAHLPGSIDISVMTIVRKHKPMSTSTMTFMLAGTGFSRTSSGSFPGGFAMGPLSNPSTAAQTGGVIQMVRPFAIVGATAGGEVGIVRTTIHFIPEPGVGLALACASLLLVLAGARRRA